MIVSSDCYYVLYAMLCDNDKNNNETIKVMLSKASQMKEKIK